jgi:hypothetical protein
MKVKIGTFFLSNGDDESPQNLSVEERRKSNTADGLRWKQVKLFDRGNRQTTISFKVSRLHDTIAAAESYVLLHGLNVPAQGVAEFVLSDNSSLFLDAAECEVTASEHIGVTTNHSYTLIGGQIQTQRPL